VPAPGDYDDDGEIGGIIGTGNRSTRRKPASVPLCPPQTPLSARTRTRPAATNRLSYGMAIAFMLPNKYAEAENLLIVFTWYPVRISTKTPAVHTDVLFGGCVGKRRDSI
jgi:hypothetical protein